MRPDRVVVGLHAGGPEGTGPVTTPPGGDRAESWKDDAECAGLDPDLFFPPRGDKSHETAVEVCAQCSVQEECLEYALEHQIWIGVWGGYTVRQRKKMRNGVRGKPELKAAIRKLIAQGFTSEQICGSLGIEYHQYRYHKNNG